MLNEVIAFLNDKNREYAAGDADYNWSVWADNCAHTLRNALAAANIWSPLSVRATKVLQLFNLAVPANEFVNLADLYDTTFRLFTLQSPLRMSKTEHAIELLSYNRFVDLGANLRYFREKYDAILSSRDESRDGLASVRGTPYRRVERLHYDYVKKQRAEVEFMLKRLSAFNGSPTELQTP
jgi:hypothetical protein